jgi:hypothetical protein
MFTPASLIARADQYALRAGTQRTRPLGQGKDGAVWQTSRFSAIKVHELAESYLRERDAYIRLEEVGLSAIAGFAIPSLIAYDDELRALEMEIVLPPFIVDFASARLDIDPQLIEDEGNTLEDFVRSRFDERTDTVMGIYYELIAKAGVYLTDLHHHNIKFGP